MTCDVGGDGNSKVRWRGGDGVRDSGGERTIMVVMVIVVLVVVPSRWWRWW